MAKKIKAVLKLNLKGGSANPAPPVGPILGQAGVNIMEFCNQYNEKTKDRRGEVIPALITVFEDRSFKFELRLAPVSAMISAALKLKKGSATTGKETVGSLTDAQITEIAEKKMSDTNTTTLQSMKNMVIGTARSMGVAITE